MIPASCLPLVAGMIFTQPVREKLELKIILTRSIFQVRRRHLMARHGVLQEEVVHLRGLGGAHAQGQDAQPHCGPLDRGKGDAS